MSDEANSTLIEMDNMLLRTWKRMQVQQRKHYRRTSVQLPPE
jgi:hypothetical protein